MALTITVQDHWTDGKRLHVTGLVNTSGNYTTGGDTLNFNNTAIKSASPPVFVAIEGQGVNFYKYIPGTTIANGKMFGVAAGVQFTGGAGFPADTIHFHAIFPKFI